MASPGNTLPTTTHVRVLTTNRDWLRAQAKRRGMTITALVDLLCTRAGMPKEN